jgi:glutamine synthetase
MMKLDANRHYVPATKQEVLAQAQAERVQFISLWFTDIMGSVKSVLAPISELENIIDNGVHFDGSSLEGFARVAESDMVLVPDLATYALLPWTQGEDRTARVICSVHTPQGDPFIGDPRNVLIRALKAAEEMGYVFKTGMELEFFLFRQDEQGRPLLNAPIDHSGYFDVADDQSLRALRRMITLLTEMGIGVDSTHSEIGYGQHEIDFQYNHALVSADHILTARITAKTLAHAHGLFCTFMPRPIADMPGSGMHTHQSLHECSTGQNSFMDRSHEYGLSEVARQFLAGQLAHARAMSAVLAPLVNSYKRLGTSFEAPVYVTWAHINRSALIRVPSTAPGKETHTRLELRCPDPAANPYLAKAVMLMAGLDGIRQRMALPDPLEETLLARNRGRLRQVEVLPASLGEALDALTADDVVLNALGPYISDRYVSAKRQEVDAYNRQVTAWELERYLTRF